MKSAKSLKLAAVDDPHRIGQTHNLRAVKHHLTSSDPTAQALAAEAAEKLASAEPSRAQLIRPTLEETASRSSPEIVTQRAIRALSHIDSQLDTDPSQNTESIGTANSRQNEQTQIYQPGNSTVARNYCSVCGTKLPDTGPRNFCPGCGTELS